MRSFGRILGICCAMAMGVSGVAAADVADRDQVETTRADHGAKVFLGPSPSTGPKAEAKGVAPGANVLLEPSPSAPGPKTGAADVQAGAKLAPVAHKAASKLGPKTGSADAQAVAKPSPVALKSADAQDAAKSAPVASETAIEPGPKTGAADTQDVVKPTPVALKSAVEPGLETGAADVQDEVKPAPADLDAASEPLQKTGPSTPVDVEKISDKATYAVYDCWWTEPVDQDGDGYTRSRKLNIDADTDLASASVYVKVWYRLVGASTWTLDYQTAPYTITGNSSSDAIWIAIGTVPEYSNGTYQFAVELFTAAGTFVASRSYSVDTDLQSQKFETPAQDTLPPGPPSLSSPANGATVSATSVTFSWTVPSGSPTKYNLQVSTSSTFATTVWDGEPTSSSHTLTGFPNDGTVYHWRVRAWNAGGWGSWSVVRNFTNGTVSYSLYDCWWTESVDLDGDGYTRERKLNIDADTTLSSASVYVKIWYRLVGASTWNLDWQTSAFTINGNSSSDAIWVRIGQAPEYPHGTYQFKVELFTAAGVLVATRDYNADTDLQSQKFETAAQDTVPPGAPSLSSPANGATVGGTSVAFSWTTPSGSPTKYNLQVSTSSTFATTVWNGEPTSSPHTLTGFANDGTVYYWRVRAWNAGGWGVWSVVRNFTGGNPYSIWDCWWTEPVDLDGDGYTQERKLNIDADTTLSSASVYVKVWYRLVGSSTWNLDWQTAAFTINGNSSADAIWVRIGQSPQYPYGTYQFKVELFTAAGILVATRDYNADTDLQNQKFETPAQDLPVVTVTATDAVAGEPGTGQGTGTFTFTRTGPTTSALTVNFSVGGTATSGTDYQSLGTSVVIPAGSASATKTVTVIDDSLIEGDETVIVTVTSGTGYTVGSPSSATVTIKDDDSSPSGEAVRSISGTTVTIVVTPAPGTSAWGVEELLPTGLTPSNISAPNGNWNSSTRKITWYGTGASTVTLSYTVACDTPGATYNVSGIVNFDGGANQTVTGPTTIVCGGTHPADLNNDWRIEMSEAIGFAARWQQGLEEMSYAIKALSLWQNGECYHRESGAAEPGCWVPDNLSMGVAAAGQEKAEVAVAVAVRTVMDGAVTGTVSIAVEPPAGTGAWGWEEQVPAGLTPVDITGPNGSWNARTRSITWYSTGDEAATLGYAVTGPSVPYTMAGKVNFDGGTDEPAMGHTQLTIGPPSAFAGALDGGANRRYLDWFGWYNDEHWPWILDYASGCRLWVVDNGPENVWLWNDDQQTWTWTRTDWYPQGLVFRGDQALEQSEHSLGNLD